jgi:hypothetical protein
VTLSIFQEVEKKGSTCRFQLGTRTNALKYIHQFTEIFTEEGRKSVKITHKVPGQPPRLTYTPGMKASLAAAAAAAAQQQQQQPTVAAVVTPPAAGQASILHRKLPGGQLQQGAEMPAAATQQQQQQPPAATVQVNILCYFSTSVKSF